MVVANSIGVKDRPPQMAFTEAEEAELIRVLQDPPYSGSDMRPVPRPENIEFNPRWRHLLTDNKRIVRRELREALTPLICETSALRADVNEIAQAVAELRADQRNVA